MRYDSGLTPDQINAFLGVLVDTPTREALGGEAPLIVGLRVGLIDGELVETSSRGTVMLPEPWPVIDARVAAIKAAMGRGASFRDAAAGVAIDEAQRARGWRARA